MAFGHGIVSAEAEPIKRYIGIAPVYVEAVNPNKAELSKLQNREVENEPEYIKSNETGKTVRIDIYVKTDEKVCGIELHTKLTFFLTAPNSNWSDGKKKQVIDEFGRTAWVMQDEFNSKTTVLRKNDGGTYEAQITPNYRLACKNEEYISEFLREFLCLNPTRVWDNNQGAYVESTKDASPCRLDHPELLFNGDFSEIRNIINYQPMNRVRVAIGVREVDGRQYQDVFNRMFVRVRNTSNKQFEKEINEAKSYGSYPNTTFEIAPLHEYIVTPTTFETQEEESTDDLPW